MIILTAMGDRIYGETPEDGIVARVYGDPALALKMAAATEMLEALEASWRMVWDKTVEQKMYAAICKAKGTECTTPK